MLADTKAFSAFVDTIDLGGGFPSGLPGAPSPAAFRQALDRLIAREKLAVPPRRGAHPPQRRPRTRARS